MRLWSIHPAHLDRMGLLACWREALLAQSVLAGRTKGYRSHPQLVRFADMSHPVAGIGEYLSYVHDDSAARGYRFDRARIIEPLPAGTPAPARRIPVTRGQLEHEWAHLGRKLAQRSPLDAQRWQEDAESYRAHPMFTVVPGPVADWERI